jgi:hypothetical protein
MPLVLLVALVLNPLAGQQSDAVRLFDGGVTWQQFLDDAHARRNVWQTNAGRTSFDPALVERLKRAGDGLTLLAVAVDACSDSVHTIPYIANLAAQAGIDLRIVHPSAGATVLERYRTPDDRGATPTVVLIRGGKEVGAWVERPEPLQSWFLSMSHVSQRVRVDRKMSWYEWDRGDTTVEEFVALVESTVSKGGSRRELQPRPE